MSVAGTAVIGGAWAILIGADPALTAPARLEALLLPAGLLLVRTGEAAVDIGAHHAGARPRGLLPHFAVISLLAVPAAIVIALLADTSEGRIGTVIAYYGIQALIAGGALWYGLATLRSARPQRRGGRAAALQAWLQTLDR